uniref:Leucine rich repeat containing 72 n=1 Tax=Cyanistes caeruleus TaxID=156563 RepID=A0A8C0VFC2_CYACU
MFEHSAPVERDTRGWCSLPWVCLRRCHSALPSGVSRRAGAWHPHAWGVARLRFSRDHLVFCDGFCTCRNKTMAIYARSFLYPTAAVDSWPCRVPRRRQGPAQSVWNERPAIENQLKICGYKNNVDVVALYLARQGLRSIPSLAQFRRLRYLWINNNKIQDLTFLTKNYYLTELYLNNNELTDISDLFQNPLAYDPDYRLYVIYFLPSVQLLDRKLVTQRERESALHLYNPKRAWVMQSIAFGKRADTSLGTTVGSSRCTQPARRPIIPSGIHNTQRKTYIFRSFELETVFFHSSDKTLLVLVIKYKCIKNLAGLLHKVSSCSSSRQQMNPSTDSIVADKF